MNSFGEYLRNKREQLALTHRKVADELNIDTSILSKIERSEGVVIKEIQIKFIQSTVLSELGDLDFLADGLKNVLKKI